MSLLMQALKKAEHAKQKQSDLAADDAPPEKDLAKTPEDALSLSPKDAVAAPMARPDVAAGKAATSAPDNPDAPRPAFTLSPQADEKSIPLISDEMDLESPSSARTGMPQPEQFAEDSRTPMPGATDAVKPEREVAGRPVNAPAEDADRIEPGAKNLARPSMPKIGAEHKQTAAQTDKAISTAQKAAKSVFSSKRPPNNRRNLLIAGLVLTISMVLGGLGYIYWQSMDVGTGIAVASAPRLAPPVAASPIELPVPAPGVAEAAAQPATAGATPVTLTPAPAPASSAPAMTKSAGPAPVETREPREQAIAADSAASDSPASRKAAAPTPKAQAAQPDSGGIQIRQSGGVNQINPGVNSAYQLFVSGDSAAAKLQYQKVLQQEPGNRDALLGMAAIALNQRQPEQAGSFYGKLLELDPADPEAIAGLTGLQQGDPVQSESRLKKVLSLHPQSGALLFALGNLYAQQSRWADAQQTYFRAYASTPSNADYAFNLAVSLDRLNQPKLAHEYYQRALDLGQRGPGNFSRNGVQKRIRELETPAGE